MANIEKVIAGISPGWALKRAKQRKALAFEAAVQGRLRGHATRDSLPNDYTEARDRMDIIRQARDLRDNFGLFAAIIRKLAIYSLGRVRYRAHTGDPETNKTIDSYIRYRSFGCDVSGRYSLSELARMALSEVLTAGDIGCLFRDSEAGTSPQLIEADRIGGNLALPVSNNQYGGVTFDPDTGKIISYTVYDRTPANGYINKREIPSGQMVHVIDPERYDRYRGISPFAPVLNEMRDLKEVMAACLIGVKFNEYHAGFITGGSGVPNDPSSYFGTSSETYGNGSAMTDVKIQPGTMQYLPEGYSANMMKSDRPSGQFQSYLELLIRTIANALGLPYGFVYSLSGLGGPAARMDAAQAQRIIEYWQSVITDRLLQPIVSRWILDGVAEGEIDSKAGARMFDGDFQFPPRITIDVGRESQAGISEIQAGLGTRAEWWDEEGKDAAQQMEIIRDEALTIIQNAQKMAEMTGFPVERCLDMLDMRSNNGTPAVVSTPEVAKDAPPVVPGLPDQKGQPAVADVVDTKKEDEEPPPSESAELLRIRQIMAAPHIGANPDDEDFLVSALDASKRLNFPDNLTPEEWLDKSSKIKYN
jgi:capsid protein